MVSEVMETRQPAPLHQATWPTQHLCVPLTMNRERVHHCHKNQQVDKTTHAQGQMSPVLNLGFCNVTHGAAA